MDKRKDQPGKAFLFILGSSCGFAITNALVKELGQTYSSMQTVFFRTSLNFVILLPFLFFLPYKERPAIGRLSPTRQDFRVLLTRSIAGFSALCCYFFAIPHLPLSISSLLYNLSPAFVILFSHLFLKEPVERFIKIAGVFAFLGLGLLLEIWKVDYLISSSFLFYCGIALCGSAFAGAAQLAVRAATARIGSTTVVLFFTGLSACMSLPFALLNWTPPHSEDWGKFLLLGIFSGLSQLLMTEGYGVASAGYVSVLMLMNVPFSLGIGFFHFHEMLEIVQYLGMAILLLSLVGLALKAAERSRRVK